MAACRGHGKGGNKITWSDYSGKLNHSPSKTSSIEMFCNIPSSLYWLGKVEAPTGPLCQREEQCSKSLACAEALTEWSISDHWDMESHSWDQENGQISTVSSCEPIIWKSKALSKASEAAEKASRWPLTRRDKLWTSDSWTNAGNWPLPVGSPG